MNGSSVVFPAPARRRHAVGVFEPRPMAADRFDAVPVRGHPLARQLHRHIAAIGGVRPFELRRSSAQRRYARGVRNAGRIRSEEHTSELQSLMRISYAVFCLKKKNNTHYKHNL